MNGARLEGGQAMELIINLNHNVGPEEINIIQSLGAKVIFKSHFIPLIGIEVVADFAQREEIDNLPFVKGVRSSLKGEYLEGDFLTSFFFTPPISRKSLSKADYYGWGDTRVAIIDSGANIPGVVEHKDFTNTGNNDLVGHGTNVAQIIKYFAKGANLYCAKVGNDEPDEIATMRALEWAANEKKVNVINMSIGFKRVHKCKGDCELSQIIEGIAAEGIITVTAAGNDGPKNNSLRCPSCSPAAVTVGALEGNESVFNYSSRGTVGGSKPNIVAPGTVYIDDMRFGGTSCACPVVTGTVAAVVSKVNNVNTIYKSLYGSAVDLKLPRHIQGTGALNIDKFVEVIYNATMGGASERQEPS